MKTVPLFIVFVAILNLIVADEIKKVRFDDYQVFRVTPKTEEAVRFLQNLEENFLDFSFWTSAHAVNYDVDIMVSPDDVKTFKEMLDSKDFTIITFIENVQDLIDNERPKARSYRGFGWTDYHTLDEIHAWLKQLATENPKTVTLINAGRSYEGRDILGVKLSFKSGNEKKSAFIEGNIHAREWISSAVVTYILNQLVTSTDSTIRALAESRDWYIFPVTNPDGFVFTHNSNRLWRKTRVPYGNNYGADPNRNWAYYWNNGGTSSSPSSETYRGPSAFSEPCTKSLSDFISTVGANLQAYIAFHSYSQYLLLPYGYSNAKLDNYNDLASVGNKAVTSLSKRYGTKYVAGNIVDLLYVASGGSMDWVKGTYGTPITYTYELRDTGRYGFVLPASQIIPSGEETLDSLVTIFEEFDKILN